MSLLIRLAFFGNTRPWDGTTPLLFHVALLGDMETGDGETDIWWGKLSGYP